jgi:hypothetical protein
MLCRLELRANKKGRYARSGLDKNIGTGLLTPPNQERQRAQTNQSQ